MRLPRLFNSDRRTLMIFAAVISVWAVRLAFGSDDPTGGHDNGAGGHSSPVTYVLLELIIVLLAAKLGGDLFERINQPAVLGELIIGMLIGNLHLVGFDVFEPFKHDITLEILAEIGVIILLFQVGLESTVREMLRVGGVALLVAILGVVTPFFLGWGVAAFFLPEASLFVHLFIGATLCATSVGITARVLKDIGRSQSQEAKIILGAAVIDDILGLVILATVTGIITAVNTGNDGLSSVQIFLIIGKAIGFVIGAVVAGIVLLPIIFKAAFVLRSTGVFLTLCLLICFLLAYLAQLVGLAPIVGAFAAGLILEDVHYKDFMRRDEHEIEELIEPIAVFLVPIFFVRMGMLVDLTTFAQVEILGFAAVLTLAAIVGKQACSLGVFQSGISKLSVGLGMIPRGEVGLIFAGIGASLMLNGEPVINTSTYSAVVIMVIITTLVTPPLLRAVMLRPPKPRTD